MIYEDMWTPEDIRQHYHSHRGAIYGVVADKRKTKASNSLSIASISTICSL